MNMNLSIRSLSICVALTLCTSSFLSFAKEHFAVQLLDTGLINNETKIYLYEDTQEIGFISYTKIPLLSWYILHTFYVHPEVRNRGYGTKLLVHSCDTLKNSGAQVVYIQPGPFEIINGKFQNVQSPEPNIKKLVKLYTKYDFIPVDRITRIFTYILYTCMGIDENPEHLLYRSLSN